MIEYNKYKIYIESLFSNIVAKTKSKKLKKSKTIVLSNTGNDTTFAMSTQDTGITRIGGTEPLKMLNSALAIPPNKESKKPHGHFEGTYWVWPNGQRTHVRFIDKAIRQMRPLPRGFYIEAEKETYLTNMKAMLRKAKQLKLSDSIDIRNEK